MSELINTASPRLVLVKPWRGNEAGPSSFTSNCDDHESLTIPNRGIVLAALLSSVLWATLILAAREAWLLLH